MAKLLTVVQLICGPTKRAKDSLISCKMDKISYNTVIIKTEGKTQVENLFIPRSLKYNLPPLLISKEPKVSSSFNDFPSSIKCN